MTIQEFITHIQTALQMPFSFLGNPKKRIYIWYLLSAFFMACMVYYRLAKEKRTVSLLSFLFPLTHWRSNSARVDYLFLFFNALIKVFFIGPYLILGLYLAYYTQHFLAITFGQMQPYFSMPWLLFLYTLTLTVVGDFMSFLVHYAFHKIPVLWEFHKIHHSATVLNPITQYRLHPIELVVNNAKSLLVFGLVTGFFEYLSAAKLEVISVIGVNVFSFIFLLLGANLRHSHIRFSYFPFLEYIFISPFQHQIHHSDNPKHFDKNMGSKLAIWDLIFGTLVRSKNTPKITYGLSPEQNEKYAGFWANVYLPFVALFKRVKKAFYSLF